MAALRFVPFFIFILILYNIIAFSGVDLNATLFTLPLISEATVQFSTSTLLLFLGVVILYIEILKATKTSVATVIDHTLSMIVFVIYIIEFLVVDVCGNDTFFLLVYGVLWGIPEALWAVAVIFTLFSAVESK